MESDKSIGGRIVTDLRERLEKILESISKILTPKKEESEIPEEWLKPEQEQRAPMDWLFGDKPPLAAEPVFVFPKDKKRWAIRIPWFKKAKRVVAFLLIIFSVTGMVGSAFDLTYIFYFLPVTGILLDYLLKTQPRKSDKWYILDNIEDE